MRTSRRQWIRNAATSGPFFLDTSVHAQRLGLVPPSASQPPPPPAAAAAAAPGSAPAAAAAPAASTDPHANLNTTDQAAWDVTHAALAAAGLSEEDIAAFAASMPPSGPGLTKLLQPRRPDNSLAAVLSSADAELAAHIASQSLASRDGSLLGGPSSSSSGSKKGGDEVEGLESGRAAVAKFVRDFEQEPLDLTGVGWGLSGQGSTSRWEPAGQGVGAGIVSYTVKDPSAS